MADMMGALLQLDGVQDPSIKDERTGQTITGRVQALMQSIEGDIKDCGNLIDTYAKHSLPSSSLSYEPLSCIGILTNIACR